MGRFIEFWRTFFCKVHFSIILTDTLFCLHGTFFGTITRSDGKKQSTYKVCHYITFPGMAKPGDMNRGGLNKVWYLVYTQNFDS